ncbi:MAG: hypothetical protein GYB68_19925 [Chloroflexi bacterium]|nr:hypothetical protein [Chloroflexota bacterium]
MSDPNGSASKPSAPPTEVNPETTRQTRRETFRQIMVPMALFALLSFIGIALLVIFTGPNGVAVVANYVLVLVLLPLVLLAMPLLALLVWLTHQVTDWIGSIPPYTLVAQEGLKQVHTKVDEVTDLIAKQVIQIKGFTLAAEMYLKQANIIPDDDETSSNGSGPSQTQAP